MLSKLKVEGRVYEIRVSVRVTIENSAQGGGRGSKTAQKFGYRFTTDMKTGDFFFRQQGPLL